MLIGRDLYGRENELMLAKGVALTETEISRIKALRYQGVYIDDGEGDNFEISSGISDHLRNRAVRTLKQVFKQVEADPGSLSRPDVLGGAMGVTSDIVQEISVNKNVSVNMIDLKMFDDYTYHHSVNVSVISVILGYAMGLSKNDLYKLGLGTLLHDIGKVFVPKEFLNKPSKLTLEEFEAVKAHSRAGSDYLREHWDIPYMSNVTVLTHHEKFDGSGYPNKLVGEKIPNFGRIAAVADVYDALTSDRPYRKGLLPSEGMEYIMGGSGSLFDPSVVKTFTRRILPFPTGTAVMLSNGLKGIVVENFPGCGTRPKVQIICDSPIPVYYDLFNDGELLSITITNITDL
ncbi:MAG TPA: HD-GYP domain-containing protein [Terriglobales bacterium]|nr:HD-GYP domain-containing protein [Terriglobales bacterium]